MSPSSAPAEAECTEQKLLEEIRDNTRTISLKLFGTTDAEAEEDKESGRLPKVERGVKHAHQRIDAIEKQVIRAVAYAAGIAVPISASIAIIVDHLLKK